MQGNWAIGHGFPEGATELRRLRYQAQCLSALEGGDPRLASRYAPVDRTPYGGFYCARSRYVGQKNGSASAHIIVCQVSVAPSRGTHSGSGMIRKLDSAWT